MRKKRKPTRISASKSEAVANAALGAVVGGIIAGPVGAAIGGVTGALVEKGPTRRVTSREQGPPGESPGAAGTSGARNLQGSEARRKGNRRPAAIAAAPVKPSGKQGGGAKRLGASRAAHSSSAEGALP